MPGSDRASLSLIAPPIPAEFFYTHCHPERSEGSIRRTSYPAATVCIEKRPSRAFLLYIQICNRLLCRKIGLFGCLRARNRPFWCLSGWFGGVRAQKWPFWCSSGWFGGVRARKRPFWCSSSVTGAPGQGKSAPVAGKRATRTGERDARGGKREGGTGATDLQPQAR